tara:strand:- start:5211 stop:5774 length:564 start_codon:yes stop_codon:yes gene_type:complete
MKEINCPSDCGYLSSAQIHPPAVIQRQQEKDMAFFLPILQHLSSSQRELLILILNFIGNNPLNQTVLIDEEVVHATKALAKTYETASRGIIYQHTANLPSAERLADDIRKSIEDIRKKHLKIDDIGIASVMRSIERSASQARSHLPGDNKAFIKLLERILRTDQDNSDNATGSQSKNETSGLIIPGN